MTECPYKQIVHILGAGSLRPRNPPGNKYFTTLIWNCQMLHAGCTVHRDLTIPPNPAIINSTAIHTGWRREPVKGTRGPGRVPVGKASEREGQRLRALPPDDRENPPGAGSGNRVLTPPGGSEAAGGGVRARVWGSGQARYSLRGRSVPRRRPNLGGTTWEQPPRPRARGSFLSGILRPDQEELWPNPYKTIACCAFAIRRRM